MSLRIRRSSRRAFLGRRRHLVGLPFLESALPREVRAAAATAPVRLVYIYLPNGLDMATFRPTAAGAGYPTPPMLVPLEALKADFSVVTGLENITARPDDPGDHASGTSSFITCAHANKSETDIRLGISADQVAAQAFGSQTRLAVAPARHRRRRWHRQLRQRLQLRLCAQHLVGGRDDAAAEDRRSQAGLRPDLRGLRSRRVRRRSREAPPLQQERARLR